MDIAYSEEQQALKSELRAYYEELLTPELEVELSQAAGVGPTVRRVVKKMATDGWLGIGWPEESLGHRAVHLLRRVDAQRGPGAHADDQHGRADNHAFRVAGAEGVLPSEDPGG